MLPLLQIARAEPTSAQKSSDDYGSASRPDPSSIRRRHATFEDNSRSPAILLLETDTRMLKEGDRAPAFTAATDSGTAVSLASLRGRRVILYFYPKDETSG